MIIFYIVDILDILLVVLNSPLGSICWIHGWLSWIDPWAPGVGYNPGCPGQTPGPQVLHGYFVDCPRQTPGPQVLG